MTLAAVLQERSLAIGMTQAQVNTLSAYGLTNLAAVAFSCSYVPGAADDAPVTALMAAIWLAGVAVNLAASAGST